MTASETSMAPSELTSPRRNRSGLARPQSPYSKAPTSTPSPQGRAEPSKSSAGASTGVPASIAAAVEQPVTKRSKEQAAEIATYFRHRDVDYLVKRFAWIMEQRPLPADAKMTQLKAALTKAGLPVTDPAPLVQLRKDVAMSIAQSADRRLTGAQDLTWALINNPAFLFNH